MTLQRMGKMTIPREKEVLIHVLRTASVMVAVLAAAALGGCRPCPETIVPLDELVARYNHNAAKAPRLWARAEITATFKDPRSHLPFTWQSPTGLLLLQKADAPLGPHGFALVGFEAGEEVFRVGSSPTDGAYYFWYGWGSSGECRWGRLKYAGASGVEGVEIDPLQLLAVLGMCELPVDFTGIPTVALTMNTTPGKCAYVLTYIDRRPVSGRITFRREMYFRWAEDAPCRPFMIKFFDDVGRRVMTAKLSNYKPVDCSDLDNPPDEDPLMPSRIEITWVDPVSGKFKSRVRIRLSEMTAEDKWDPDVLRFWKNLPPGLGPKCTQVDGHLDPGGPKP